MIGSRFLEKTWNRKKLASGFTLASLAVLMALTAFFCSRDKAAKSLIVKSSFSSLTNINILNSLKRECISAKCVWLTRVQAKTK